ncbi:MAG: helical backbone metal receptor [Candidatus Theseobacter exili]|nr:helical backbone metal receptor [Candidatus Theseobacter exili]
MNSDVKIVSVSPSITEILFALDLGEKVVGVTRFCTYPPETCVIPKIGGYYDLNYEVIVALEPDIAIIRSDNEHGEKELRRLGLKCVTVDNETIEGILASIKTIGTLFNVLEKAELMLEDINRRIKAVKQKVAAKSTPSVMISVERSQGSGMIKNVFVAGKEGFYDEMINLAGGKNACVNEKIKFPKYSSEGILKLNPQIIIDLVPDSEKEKGNVNKILADWNCIEEVDAVKNKRVYVFSQDYFVIPGPRFILILEKIANIISGAKE